MTAVKVAKFGGSSLASAELVKQVCGIITADPQRRVVVVSAPGKRDADDIKVTDLLIGLAEARLADRSTAELLQRVTDRFGEIVEGLGLPETCLNSVRADLEKRLDLDRADGGRFTDSIKAAGEANGARLVAESLRSTGAEAHYLDPKEGGLILSDEPGNARILRQSYGALRRLRERPGITIFPGFFGYSESGEIVTFPRGGSDITGAILAAAVDADLYENFTDVDSIFAANPAIVDAPKPVSEITYREMRELSYAGFSVFHDEALETGVPRRDPGGGQEHEQPAGAGNEDRLRTLAHRGSGRRHRRHRRFLQRLREQVSDESRDRFWPAAPRDLRR